MHHPVMFKDRFDNICPLITTIYQQDNKPRLIKTAQTTDKEHCLRRSRFSLTKFATFGWAPNQLSQIETLLSTSANNSTPKRRDRTTARSRDKHRRQEIMFNLHPTINYFA